MGPTGRPTSWSSLPAAADTAWSTTSASFSMRNAPRLPAASCRTTARRCRTCCSRTSPTSGPAGHTAWVASPATRHMARLPTSSIPMPLWIFPSVRDSDSRSSASRDCGATRSPARTTRTSRCSSMPRRPPISVASRWCRRRPSPGSPSTSEPRSRSASPIWT